MDKLKIALCQMQVQKEKKKNIKKSYRNANKS